MTPRIVSERQYLCAAVALGLTTLAPSVCALSFGTEQVTSFLGQPLRLSIPLLGAPGDSLEARCFRIGSPNRVDGLSVVNQARIELEAGNTPRLLVRSVRSIEEPVVRIAIEAICDTPIRREYTVLLDPPPLTPRESAVAPDPSLAVSPPTVVARGPTAGVSAGGALAGAATPPQRQSTRTTSDDQKRRASPPKSGRPAGEARPMTRDVRGGRSKSPPAVGHDGTSAARAADELRVQGGPVAGGVAIEDASIAALAIPRLRIASELPTFNASVAVAGTPVAADKNELQAAIAKERRARLFSAPIEEDLAPRLEADLVVAQRRLAELQAQIAAAGGAAAPAGNNVTGLSAKPAAGDSPSITWDWKKWLWAPASLLVLGLLVFLLRQRQAQRQQARFANAGPVTVVQHGDEFETVMPTRTVANTTSGRVPSNAAPQAVAGDALAPGTEAPSLVPAPGGPSGQMSAKEASEASDRLISPLFQLRDTESHVDVTELSQITDEAQVYSDLGRNDQAIEILRAHIDSQEGQDVEHSSPAPWLMIFDLYRRTNNRAGYDELAPRFRRQFNGRMPDWDNYGHELALDDGLEAFPHLVSRIERDWGTVEAKKFLEELLYDNRGGSRLGFSLAAYRDILLLLQLHEGLTAVGAEQFPPSDWESRGANDTDGTPKWDLSLDMIDTPKPGELDSFLRNMPPPDKS